MYIYNIYITSNVSSSQQVHTRYQVLISYKTTKILFRKGKHQNSYGYRILKVVIIEYTWHISILNGNTQILNVCKYQKKKNIVFHSINIEVNNNKLIT